MATNPIMVVSMVRMVRANPMGVPARGHRHRHHRLQRVIVAAVARRGADNCGSVEASGKSIEDAILQALVRLGRNRDEVDITVLQEPSRGRRGIGTREARVRVYLKQGRAAPEASYRNAQAYEEEEEDQYNQSVVESYDEDEVYADTEPFPFKSLPVGILQELLPEDASMRNSLKKPCARY